LPVGRGKRFDLGSRIANGILGGWSMNVMSTLQVGPPLAWGNVIYHGGDLHLNPHQADAPIFDVTRFNTVAAQQLASNIRTFGTYFNNLRRDATRNCDVSMLKRISLGESKYLQLRFEAFNVTNRVGFAAPNMAATSTAFGLITATANTPRKIQAGARIVW
jgi:hypothetical protein